MSLAIRDLPMNRVDNYAQPNYDKVCDPCIDRFADTLADVLRTEGVDEARKFLAKFNSYGDFCADGMTHPCDDSCHSGGEGD